jgi:OmpA-OmpF porin, OOP family
MSLICMGFMLMTIKSFALAGVALLALSSSALAGEGWYAGLGAGWDTLNDPKISGPAYDGKLNTNDTALVIASFGYKMNNWRFEIEPGWASHGIKSVDFTGGGSESLNGHVRLFSAMANAIYDFPITERWKFSVGGGLGVGNDQYDASAGGVPFLRSSARGFMWQGIGGFAYEVSPTVDLFADYRYRDSEARPDQSLIGGGFEHIHDAADQAVLVGFRWYPERVAEMAPPPPLPPPPPPAPPPAPPPTKTFIVFFDFNKSNLTAEAQSVVSEAVKAAQQTGAVRVVVTGHTDTVGSDSYNMGLSVRRAQSVKSEMVQQGMSGDAISIEGKGFHDPLVPTGPGVREPQNRRAVIDLGG